MVCSFCIVKPLPEHMFFLDCKSCRIYYLSYIVENDTLQLLVLGSSIVPHHANKW